MKPSRVQYCTSRTVFSLFINFKMQESPRDDTAQTVLRSTRSGVSSLVTGAIATKVLNFFANVLVTRFVGRAALGVGSLRLDDFLFLGPLVLVREGLRKAAYRTNTDASLT